MEAIDRFEAAGILGVWPRTIQKWASDGRIGVATVVCNEATKGHATRMYSRAEIEALHEELYPTINVSPGFGHWLCGFIDGEGCFVICPRNGQCIDCRFSIVQRADNKAILERIRDELGIGTVRLGRSPNGSSPTYEFVIYRKWECMAFVRLIERYGLLGNKSQDFGLWARAVRIWCKSGRYRDSDKSKATYVLVEELRRQLNRGRKYQK